MNALIYGCTPQFVYLRLPSDLKSDQISFAAELKAECLKRNIEDLAWCSSVPVGGLPAWRVKRCDVGKLGAFLRACDAKFIVSVKHVSTQVSNSCVGRDDFGCFACGGKMVLRCTTCDFEWGVGSSVVQCPDSWEEELQITGKRRRK